MFLKLKTFFIEEYTKNIQLLFVGIIKINIIILSPKRKTLFKIQEIRHLCGQWLTSVDISCPH